MGYIHDVTQALADKLSDLDEARQKDIIQFVKDKVWESYKNGKDAGGTGKTDSGEQNGRYPPRPSRKFTRTS